MKHRVLDSLLKLASPSRDVAPTLSEAYKVLLLIESECLPPNPQGNLLVRMATPMTVLEMRRDHVRSINDFIIAHQDKPNGVAPPDAIVGMLHLGAKATKSNPLPQGIREALSHWEKRADRIQRPTAKKSTQIDHADSVVAKVEGDSVYVRIPSVDSKLWQLTQFANHPPYNSTRRLLKPGDELSLIFLELNQERAEASAGFIILEPGYLVPATTLSQLFYKRYGGAPEAYSGRYFLNLLDARGTTIHMFLGIAGNTLFDRQISISEAIPFDTETMRDLFRSAPLEFTNSNLFADATSIREFMGDCALLHENIGNTLRDGKLTLQGGRLGNITMSDILSNSNELMLEASYLQPRSGLQGRMDLLSRTSDGTHYAVELKSGKPPDPKWDGWLKVDHDIQAQVYDLFFRAHGVVNPGNKPERRVTSIFYSQVRNPSESLRQVKTRAYNQVPIEARNVFVHRLREVASDAASWDREQFKELCSMTAMLPKYNDGPRAEFHQRISQMPDLHWVYFRSFFAALISEHWHTQTGAASMAHKEQWLQDFEADGLDDRILNMGHVEAIDEKGCSHRFQFKADLDATAMKKGDMVLLQDASLRTLSDGPVQRGRLQENPDSTGMLTVKFMDHRPANTFQGKRWNLRLDKTSGNLKQTVSSLWDCLTSPRHASLRAYLIDGLIPSEKHALREVELLPSTLAELKASSTMELENLVQRALDASPFYLVQGPPGTGKTDLFIKNLVYNHQRENPDEKLVVTAFTNRAVDEICEKLSNLQVEFPSLQFSRIGGAESVGGRLKSNLLSEQLDGIEGLNREKVQGHIDKTHVWVSTVSTLSRNPDLMDRLDPDMMIVDEAGQLNEYLILGPISRAKRFVLVGDAKQLPAISQIPDEQAKQVSTELKDIGIHDLRASLFERLEWRHGSDERLHGGLTYHARMHPDVAWFVNQQFYDGQLKAAGTPSQLADWGWFSPEQKNPDLQCSLGKSRMIFFDTPNHDKQAKRNEAEIDRIIEILHSLQAMGRLDELCEERIGIIAPFRLQCAQLRKKLHEVNPAWAEHIDVDTVERFQGSQRDIIIFSSTVGSMAEMVTLTSTQVALQLGKRKVDRKLNVAISRTREQFIMLGDAAVLRTNATYADLLDHIADQQLYFPHGNRDVIIGTGGHPEETHAQGEIGCYEEYEKAGDPITQEPTASELQEVLPPIPDLAGALFTPSHSLQRLWRHSIQNEVRQLNGSLYGLDFSQAKHHLIDYGRADFDAAIKVGGSHFSPEHRVKTYAYTNARQHMMSLVGLLPAALSDLYRSAGPGPWQVIDVGCGPGTGVLALHELMPEWSGILQGIQYHGMDISNAMLDLGANLTRDIHILTEWHDSWPILSEKTPTLFLFSFLFGNLNDAKAEKLAEDVVAHVSHSGQPTVGLIQNSIREDRNYATDAFLGRLRQLGDYLVLDEGFAEIQYKTTSSSDIKSCDVLFHRFSLT